MLDSPEPSTLLIFINDSHVIDLALKRGWQVLLDENEKNMCVIPLKKKPHYTVSGATKTVQIDSIDSRAIKLLMNHKS